MVVIPGNITSVTGASIMTGASGADIVSANSGIATDEPLPASAHSDGSTAPGTSHLVRRAPGEGG